ncbi:DinB family protein [Rhodovulum sp. FJ3]|uniref:DinB family protein n=1 Tax=Rhodovulum sp. FJ3 TaxID=3079053 RepID=UPI00293DD30C|nr:DinB family protein [Rhodovulum sp. FJ3]MDV4168236.1 DinB family protein [Rhodovulum sp. FJ3]
MISTRYVDEMSKYARWQNDIIYQLCEDIGQSQRERDRGLYFGSIHNTLDHICVVNRAILTFLNGALPIQNPPGHVVWPNWEDLKSVRLAQDNELSAGAGEWTKAWLAEETVTYDRSAPDLPAVPRWIMVVQLFNHQTHHRSQVTSALHAMGVDYGTTDIPWRPGAGFFVA